MATVFSQNIGYVDRRSQNMETLEFIIYPDGRVKETVTGIIGSSCQEVTAAIENQLGVVVDRKSTSEQYAQNSVQQNELSSQSNFLGW